MAKIEIRVQGYKCNKCGHTWQKRNKSLEPRMCPKCKSVTWNDTKKK